MDSWHSSNKLSGISAVPMSPLAECQLWQSQMVPEFLPFAALKNQAGQNGSRNGSVQRAAKAVCIALFVGFRTKFARLRGSRQKNHPITGAMKRPEPKSRALLTGINAHLQPRHKMKTRGRTQQRSE
jgi:hypothetical protein